MNKTECKKYLRKAYNRTIAHGKDITPNTIAEELKKVVEDQTQKYVAYSKIAVRNMQNSANEVITLKDLLEEIDILPQIYTEISAIERAKNI